MSNEIAVEVKNISKTFPHTKGLRGLLMQFSWFVYVAEWLLRKQDGDLLKKVFSNVSFSVKEGEVLGILGLNAAGKSTLLSCLSGMLEPDSGEIVVIGKKLGGGPHGQISSVNPRELFSEFTPKQHIEMVCLLHKLDKQHGFEVISNVLARVGLNSKMLEMQQTDDLSLGSRGKLALALGIIPLLKEKNKDKGMLLLLDEPTIGFDIYAVQQFFELLDELCRWLPRLTVILATNDERETAFCTRCLALVSTQLHETDSADLAEIKEAKEVNIRASEALMRMIDGGGNIQLPATPENQVAFIRSGRLRTPLVFAWRTGLDITRDYTISILLVLSLVLPNLLPLFSLTGSEMPTKINAYLMTSLGIFTTMLLRESMRFLDRERSYYLMLEKIVQSGINRTKHMASTTFASWIFLVFHMLIVAILLALLVFGFGLGELFSTLLTASRFGLTLTIGGVMIASLAVGMLATFIPLIFKQMQAYFISTMVPFLGIICSGIYYDIAVLPQPMNWIASINPITYGAAAFREFLHLPQHSKLPAVALIESLEMFPSRYVPLAVLMVTSSLYLSVSFWLYRHLEIVMRRGGRFSSKG